jgi:serine/threonine protein kinase/Tfp pilus assembly protein PilF
MAAGSPTLKTLLLEARALDEAARRAYLDRACPDPALRAEVESLLAHEADPVPLLDPGRLLAVLDTGGSADPADAPAAAPLPDRIGSYRPVEILGEGGMGIVYRAEQVAPIRREVALKLIRRGLDTDRVVARFEAERQALARLDHPFIARVLDAGATSDGRPFFVMELVRGQPVTTFADAARLDLRQRVELLLAVCRAVQHAHQKGLIHRDLKPSNILVAWHDAVPHPKVIDFGIAKAIGDPLADATLTREGQFIGTPDYMSPEQAGAIDADVDTRTDVYALGVIAYELLSGHRPYRFERATAEHVRHVLEHAPRPAPSTTVALRRRRLLPATPPDADQIRRVAADRRTTPQRLRRDLRGDLDNIVLKAVEPDPARRYASVERLAEDLRRYLDGLPVEARAASWPYRTAKFVRRHRMGVALAATAVLLLAAFVASTLVQSARVARERDRAVAAEQRARREAATAERMIAFLVSLFTVADPGEARGSQVTAREILDRGAGEIGRALEDDPEVRARLTHTMGQVYKQLGLYDRAAALLGDAVAAREALGAGARGAVAESLTALGDVERYRGRAEEAARLLERALHIRREVLGPDHPAVGETLNNLSLVVQEQGDLARAEALQREALQIRRAALGPRHEATANSLANLGRLLTARGRYGEAIAALEEAVAIRRVRLGPDHPDLGFALQALSQALSRAGRHDEAEPPLREAIGIVEKTLEPTHPRRLDMLNELASLLQDRGDLEAAEPLYREALAGQRRRAPGGSMDVAVLLNNLATLLEDKGEYEAARPLYEESLAMRRALRGPGHAAVATALNNLGRLHLALGAPARGEALLREALAIREAALGGDHPLTGGTRALLGRALLARGRPEAAEQELRAALAVQEARLAPTHDALATTRVALGRVLLARGQTAEAEVVLRQAIEAFTAQPHTLRRRVAEAQILLADALAAGHRPEEARSLLEAATGRLEPGNRADRALLDAAARVRTRLRRTPASSTSPHTATPSAAAPPRRGPAPG